MFDKIKSVLGRAADKLRQFAGITKDTAEKAKEFEFRLLKPERVNVRPLPRRNYWIPRSSMTKKGPGITAAVRRALRSMTPEDRLYCRAKSWDRGMVDQWGNMR